VNYISNALKYGGEPPSIRLECIRKEDRVEYAVVDNGNGIPEAERLRVFEEFARVGGEKSEGHGVGLAIVKRIVERLQGTVGVYNLPDGAGCRFYFTLPAVD
jgi:signal transduction histidine kinase